MRVGSNTRQKRIRRGSGFTLIELVVVIAVIAMLAAILFPVFIKATESARTTGCLSNMRQIGVGLALYLDDNDERFPGAIPWGVPGSATGDSSEQTIQQRLSKYIRGAMVRESGTNLYAKAGVFACPSDTGIPRVDERGNRFDVINGVPAGEPIWRYTGCSYEYYASDQQDWLHYDSNPPEVPWTGLSPEIQNGGRKGAPESAVRDPRRKAVLGDIWFWHMGDQVPVGLLAWRNTLFVDGHVRRVSGEYHIESRLEELKPWD